MSVINDVKKSLKQKIEALSTIQKAYGYPELQPDGWPAVWVLPANMDGEFTSTTENRRIYAFNLTVMFPIGQDFDKSSGMTKEEYAESVVANAMEQIINDVDTDFELASNASVLFINAADAEWGTVEYSGGVAKAVQITLMVNLDFNVSS